jgi:hypothetical protein
MKSRATSFSSHRFFTINHIQMPPIVAVGDVFAPPEIAIKRNLVGGPPRSASTGAATKSTVHDLDAGLHLDIRSRFVGARIAN